VVAEVGPGNALAHQALERARIEEAGEALWDARLGRMLLPPGEPEQAQRDGDEVCRPELVHAAHLERLPDVGEAQPGGRLADRAGDVAGMNGPDARARHDVETDGAPEPAGQVVEQVAEHARLVGAARASTRHDQSHPVPVARRWQVAGA